MVEGEGESFSSRVMRSHTGHLSDAFSYRLSDLTGTEKKAGRGLTAASKTAGGTRRTLGFRRRVLEVV